MPLITTATPARSAPPTLRIERRCWDAGERVVVGIDEVGRGAWAGPVTVAAVVPGPTHLRGVRDSKQLTREQREVAATKVRRWALAFAIGHASHEECDELGMTAAQRAAGRRCLAQLAAQGFVADRIILDGSFDYLGLGAKVTTVVKGDTKCLSVAAASCLAKVVRDHHMIEESVHYPAVRLRVQRGLSRARPQARARRLRAERDPPEIVGVHGRTVLARRRAATRTAVPVTSRP